MLTPKGATIGGESADNVVNRPGFVDRVFVVESDVHLGAAEEAHPKHDGFHGDLPRV